MISLVILIVVLYCKWFYESFIYRYSPDWIENADCFFYASLAEGALEFIVLIVYLGVFK